MRLNKFGLQPELTRDNRNEYGRTFGNRNGYAWDSHEIQLLEVVKSLAEGTRLLA